MRHNIFPEYGLLRKYPRNYWHYHLPQGMPLVTKHPVYAISVFISKTVLFSNYCYYP